MSLEVSEEIVPFMSYHSMDVMTDSFHQAGFGAGAGHFPRFGLVSIGQKVSPITQ